MNAAERRHDGSPRTSTRLQDLGFDIKALVPSGQTINPVTGANWERVGVKPDVTAPAPEALRVAHRAELSQLLRAAPGGPRRERLERALSAVDSSR